MTGYEKNEDEEFADWYGGESDRYGDESDRNADGKAAGKNSVKGSGRREASSEKTPDLTGYVKNIIYRNAENGYTVLEITTPEGIDVTATGLFPSVAEGATLNLYGDYVDHVNYGRQFKMISYEETLPEDTEAMKRYIGSGAIKGIGPALASRIVRKFGKDTFRIMEEEPERLSEVKGISMNRAMEISDQMVEKRDLRAAMMYLANYGIHGNLAVKLYENYGIELKNVLETNPYRMAEEVRGIGFRIADEIAQRMGVQADSAFRVRCGVLYVLGRASANGHTFLPKDQLRQDLTDLLGMDITDLDQTLDSLLVDRRIRVIDGEEIYTETLYRMEESSARMLLGLDQRPEEPDQDLSLEDGIRRVMAKEDLELDEKQIDAVKQAVTRGVFVLTGGPGTGKTTTIKAIIEYCVAEGRTVALGAPTGRAAKRMTEATGYEARTIHRMLEVRGGRPGEEDRDRGDVDAEREDRGMFERNASNPLEADVIIIDEMSMVDIYLFHALLLAVPEDASLVLVGDVNQLPSVGPGNVLRDIIDSGCFSVVKLDRIFRQATESDIVMNAHRINAGEEAKLDNKSKDFFFLKRHDADTINKLLLHYIQGNLPSYVGADPLELQILTPTRKGLTGVENLNTFFQKYMNPPAADKTEYASGDRLFRVGDKVMQIKNNYQLEWRIPGKYGITQESGTGVFNGDMGIVHDIDLYASTLTVKYDEGRLVDYDLKDLSDLELAYAVTIHKSQGSEYPAVLIPLLSGPRPLMNRNLLYTAVTRAKKCVVIIGDDNVFRNMVANVSENRRNTGLRDRILENVNQNQKSRLASESCAPDSGLLQQTNSCPNPCASSRSV